MTLRKLAENDKPRVTSLARTRRATCFFAIPSPSPLVWTVPESEQTFLPTLRVETMAPAQNGLAGSAEADSRYADRQMRACDYTALGIMVMLMSEAYLEDKQVNLSIVRRLYVLKDCIQRAEDRFEDLARAW